MQSSLETLHLQPANPLKKDATSAETPKRQCEAHSVEEPSPHRRPECWIPTQCQVEQYIAAATEDCGKAWKRTAAATCICEQRALCPDSSENEKAQRDANPSRSTRGQGKRQTIKSP